MICGIVVFYYIGFIVYSDGDVVLYVLIDVLLGVVVLGDIGKFFFDIDM